jgi:hypothetical protein
MGGLRFAESDNTGVENLSRRTRFELAGFHFTIQKTGRPKRPEGTVSCCSE